jgi:hypothetical protein
MTLTYEDYARNVPKIEEREFEGIYDGLTMLCVGTICFVNSLSPVWLASFIT